MKPTPIEVLMQCAQDHPRDIAFIFHDRIWTYEMLAAETGRFARGMAAHGVKRGDRVALHMMNRPEFLAAYYACFRIGAIAAPLRTAFTFAELAPILQRLTPVLYIGDASLYGNVAPVSASVLPHDKRFIVGTAQRDQNGAPLEKLLEGADNDNAFAPAAREPAVLITTSGTTGEPKFVVHTPSTLAETVEMVGRNITRSDEDIIAVPLALAHISGLATVLCFVQLGIRFVLLESFDANEVLDTIERYSCTWYFGFPAQYAAMLDCQQQEPRNLRSLHVCLTAGDVCPIDLQQRVTSTFGVPLYNQWGATEAPGCMRCGLRPGPVVRIAEGVQVRLIDDHGNDVADGEIGELLLRGPSIFDGYWNDPRATAESLKDGWYHTGDLMHRAGEDELMFVSRKKDIIIRGGTNISPIEVEQAIVASHIAVEEAAAVGMPDPALGQCVLGFVKLANGADEAVILEILENLRTRLAAYKIPERLIMVDALPRNAMSKIDRKALQAIADALPRSSDPIERNAPAMAAGRTRRRGKAVA